MAKIAIKALAVAALVCFVFDNASAAVTGNEDEDESESPPPSTPSSATQLPQQSLTTTTKPADRVSEGGGGARNAENRLTGDEALGRLRYEAGGRALSAAKRVVDETVHKLSATVDGIRRTISGDDADDEGGDRRVSAALDGLFRAVGTESRAAFDYASNVINETADRAKAAVDRAQQQQKPRRLRRR